MPDNPNSTIPRPSKEVLVFLQWAVGAAVNEYVNDMDDAAYAWLDEVEKVSAHAWLDEVEKACGYADTR